MPAIQDLMCQVLSSRCKTCITQIQEVQQETVQPETAIDAAVATRLGGIAEKTQGRAGLWRICDKPESEKDIATTEEDGWQIVEEYGEKTPPDTLHRPLRSVTLHHPNC